MKPFLHRSKRGLRKWRLSKFEERSFQELGVKELESIKRKVERLGFLQDKIAKSTKKLFYSLAVLKKVLIWL